MANIQVHISDTAFLGHHTSASCKMLQSEFTATFRFLRIPFKSCILKRRSHQSFLAAFVGINTLYKIIGKAICSEILTGRIVIIFNCVIFASCIFQFFCDEACLGNILNLNVILLHSYFKTQKLA